MIISDKQNYHCGDVGTVQLTYATDVRNRGEETLKGSDSVRVLITYTSHLIRTLPLPLASQTKQTPWPLVSKRTIPTERSPLFDEI
jgi:hypothetical protein